MLIPSRSVRFACSALLVCWTTAATAQPTRPIYTPNALTPTQRTARDIYKQLIEINTSVTTGNITNAAVAMAKRFRDAGIADSDIFVGGPRPERHNVVATRY